MSLNESYNNKKVNCEKMTIAEWMAAVCSARLCVVRLSQNDAVMAGKDGETGDANNKNEANKSESILWLK